MKVIRSTKCSLKYTTKQKQEQLKIVLEEYSKVVNVFINYFWKNKVKKTELLKDIFNIPEDEYFGKPPVFWHIDTNGFAFHHKYIANAQWDGWRGGDFVVACKLFKAVPNKIYIDKILTGLQRTEGWGGDGKRADKIIKKW